MGTNAALIVAMLFSVAAAFPQQVSIGKGGVVSASFGGYHASAGLGGVAGEGGSTGGLFARAGLPDGTGAGAGLGGAAGDGATGGLYAGAKVAGGPQASAGLGGVVGGAGGTEGVLHAGAAVPGAVAADLPPAVGTGFVTKAGGSIHVVKKPTTLFDDIFNIPTSVLKAVNQYLNNKAGK